MPMLYTKAIAILIKRINSLATGSGYFKTPCSSLSERKPSITAASLCKEIHWEREEEEKRGERENISVRQGIDKLEF